MAEDTFPSGKIERGRIFAKTGLKVGANYARYLAKKSVGEGDRKDLDTRNARDIYREFTRLRGTALKLAQSLSMDTGILPDEYVDVMTQAQYSVPPMNRALVRKIIHDSLGKYPEQVFKSFEPEATAAASIGQVHRAVLNDGTRVAVKIQYPNVRETIQSDMTIAKTLFKRLVKAEQMDVYFDEIREKLIEETNYLHEGKMIEFFSKQYSHDQIITPKWIPEFSSENVLTMTFVDGIHLDKFLESNPSTERKNHFGQLLWDFVNQQIASNNCRVHADIHPGNFLFREDGRLGVIDFGCVKQFPQDFRDDFLLLYDAQLRNDKPETDALYEKLEITKRGLEDDGELTAFYNHFQAFGQTVIDPYRYDTYSFGDRYRSALNAHYKNSMKFNRITGSRHFVFVNRIMMGLYAVLLRLQPEVDMTAAKQELSRTVDEIRERRNALKAA